MARAGAGKMRSLRVSLISGGGVSPGRPWTPENSPNHKAYERPHI